MDRKQFILTVTRKGKVHYIYVVNAKDESDAEKRLQFYLSLRKQVNDIKWDSDIVTAIPMDEHTTVNRVFG